MFGIGNSPKLHRLCGSLLAAVLLAGCSTDKNAEVAAADSTAGGVTAPPSASPPPVSAITLQGAPPASVTVGSTYSFQPSVQSSTAVNFAIVGKPPWSSFDPATGRLSGVPSAKDEGTSGHITISASNGSATASLTPFTIRINGAAASSGAVGSIQISWVAPTKNTDGTPITDLAGFHIYYGTSPGELTKSVEITGAAATTYVIGELAAGTYYFSVLAFNAAGVDSGLSNIASETI